MFYSHLKCVWKWYNTIYSEKPGSISHLEPSFTNRLLLLLGTPLIALSTYFLKDFLAIPADLFPHINVIIYFCIFKKAVVIVGVTVNLY